MTVPMVRNAFGGGDVRMSAASQAQLLPAEPRATLSTHPGKTVGIFAQAIGIAVIVALAVASAAFDAPPAITALIVSTALLHVYLLIRKPTKPSRESADTNAGHTPVAAVEHLADRA